MDWDELLQDAAVLTTLSTVIFFVVEFIKKVVQKLAPNRKIPGEIWYALSIIFGVGLAIAVFWNDFFGQGTSLKASISTAIYGLTSGVGSKLINSVASYAGAKFKASKEQLQSKEETVITTPIESSSCSHLEEVSSTEQTSVTPITNMPTYEIPEENLEVQLFVPLDNLPQDCYTIINGKIYKVKTKGGEDG